MANSINVWQGFFGSSIGKAHIDSSLPNQDACFLHQDSEFCVAVVCDGAGSAQFSQQGSKYFANEIGLWLINFAKSLDLNFKFHAQDWLNYAVIQTELSHIRQRLVEQIPSGRTLKEYHTTVTAVLLIVPLNEFVLIQIGDSPLLTTQFSQHQQNIDYFKQIQLFGDDSKNEYVNETHFITQENWQDFLRVQWFDITNIDLIALMSDGCGDLVLQGASITPTIYRPFFGNLLFNLCQTQTSEQGNAIIEQAIANPATYRLTGDDKSLITLIKNSNNYQGIEPILDESTFHDAKTDNTSNDSVWHSADMSASHSQTSQVLNHTGLSSSTIEQRREPISTVSLPPSQTLSQTGKERRKVAIIAGIAVVIGAGVLGWINRDKLSSAKDTALTATNAIKTDKEPTLKPIYPSTIASASHAFDLDSPVHVWQVGQHFDVQLVLGVPKSAVTQFPLVSNTPSSLFADYINPNTPTFKESIDFNNRYPVVVENGNIRGDWTMDYHYNCRIIDNDLKNYQSLNINFDKKYQYRLCHLSFSKRQRKDFQPIFDPTVTQLHFDTGFAPIFDADFIAKNSVASATNAVNAKTSAIKAKAIVHYLPNNFIAPATKSVSQATAH